MIRGGARQSQFNAAERKPGRGEDRQRRVVEPLLRRR